MPETDFRLGVCYYPEHWPEPVWADDARRMAGLGLSRVRIGEFAWSRIEPDPGVFDWGWLDRAIDTLHAAGLGIILGTPTATPPKWLVDSMPDMVAIDASGRERRFGSRRHYCFSHLGYRVEAVRITRALGERYGHHPALVAWQTDNEYGCHDTTYSYSASAALGFRTWLAGRYASIDALNAAWGNVFWSMDYRSFDEIDLPNLTVTEANPAHLLAFRRFSSDQVAAFNRAQADELRRLSPARDIVHNFMGFYTEFDHHAVSHDLDVATWDSYPLGFLEQFWFSDEDKARYQRQGHPDISAFHHDLYRGCANGRWWVMEQQPGPVNWARHNPAPLPGMVRFWTLEALAHGAELVSYFRWRQFPKAQEQMHAGLLRPDSSEDDAVSEIRDVVADLAAIGNIGAPQRSVALVFSYEADWVTSIQPQGAGYAALRCAFEMYSAARRLGLDIDIVSPAASLDGYAAVLVPCLPVLPDDIVERLQRFEGQVLLGPRAGSKTAEFAIPDGLPPGGLRTIFPARVLRTESLRPNAPLPGEGWQITRWLETLETAASPEYTLNNGRGAVFRHGRVRYLAGWPDAALAALVLAAVCNDAGLATLDLHEDIRTRRIGNDMFVFNHGPDALPLPGNLPGRVILGSGTLPPAGVMLLRQES